MFEERIKTHHSAMADAKQYAMGPRKVVQVLTQLKPDREVKEKATIYIHVPFCNKICSFCNMRRRLQQPLSHYHELIIKEIEAYSMLPYIQDITFDAIYFGGGTPTTLSAEALSLILRALHKYFNLTKEVEITVETTVTELTREKIKALKDGGVTRLSVGVQTFNDRGRKLMGRIGSGETAYNKLKELKAAGFKTISMDLIYNYEGQTLEELVEDLEKIAALELDGFSMYSLIDMKQTTISKAQSLSEDKKRFDTIAKTMMDRGYRFLELTKMVRGDEYKYVMNRHVGADTLPLGAGAGGSLGGLMLMNDVQLEKYEESVLNFEEKQGMLFAKGYQNLSRFKGMIQTLKLPEDTSLYKNKEAYEKIVEEMLQKGYIEQKENHYHLTTEGVFWGNNISRTLYELSQH